MLTDEGVTSRPAIASKESTAPVRVVVTAPVASTVTVKELVGPQVDKFPGELTVISKTCAEIGVIKNRNSRLKKSFLQVAVKVLRSCRGENLNNIVHYLIG